jgi:hypothetical protein
MIDPKNLPHRVRVFFHEEKGIKYKDLLFETRHLALEFIEKIEYDVESSLSEFMNSLKCHSLRLFDYDDQPVDIQNKEPEQSIYA